MRRSKMFTQLKVLLAFSLLGALACSGGGESSGGGKSGKVSTGARVIHGAIDAPSISLKTSVKAGEVLGLTQFALEAPYVDLPRGAQVLELTVGDGNDENFRYSVDVKKNERRTYVLYGTREVFGVHVSEFIDAPPKLAAGSAAVRIVHALAGASQITVTAGDTALPPVSFSGASEYVTVPAGTLAIRAERTSDQRTVLSVVKDLQDRHAYTVVVTGEVGYLVLSPSYEDN